MTAVYFYLEDYLRDKLEFNYLRKQIGKWNFKKDVLFLYKIRPVTSSFSSFFISMTSSDQHKDMTFYINFLSSCSKNKIKSKQ